MEIADGNNYKCPVCPFESPWFFAYEHHTKRHDTEYTRGWFECDYKVELHECNLCGFTTPLKVNLVKHNKAEHVFGLFQFVKCENGVTIKKEPDCVEYKCENCDFTTFSQLFLVKHGHEECKSKLNHRLNKTGLLEYIKHVLKAKFHKKSEAPRFSRTRIAHVVKLHATPPSNEIFPCLHCPLVFDSSNDLKSHMICVHPHLERVKWYECFQCPYRSKSKLYLQKHMSYKHADHEWLRCGHCPYKAKRKNTMKVHVLCQHTAAEEIRWFECAHCPYKAKKRNNLEKHVVFKHSALKNMRWNEFCRVFMKDETQIFIDKDSNG